MIKNIILYFKNIFTKNKSFKKKMENIKKKDPFVYWAEEDWDKKQIKLPKRKNE
jgi:hypothetical protein|tara:strand:+ start:569 stop:730 length:162 start_codon:yes stop_codon:yes gene_type:complete